MAERPGLAADAPWSGGQRSILAIGNLAGVVLLGAAWWGSAGTDDLGEQVGWVNLAVLGLVASGATNGSWLLHGRRAVGRRRAVVAPDVVVAARPAAGGWWTVPGLRRAHRAGCHLLRGRAATPVDATTIRTERLLRCEVCG